MTTVISKDFGKTKDGQKVTAYTMENGNGMSVCILDFGCTVQSITVPDRDGKPTDVALGYEDVASYEAGSCYYGAVVGRYANRIKYARVIIDGKEYHLEKNEGENHVHGIYCKTMFRGAIDGDAVVLKYTSPDTEEGYPGELNLEVRYTLTEDNALEIEYSATTDAPTVLNLTNHSCFNLNGQDGSEIFEHKITLNCSNFTEYDETFAQTGRIIPVEGTPLDFRTEHTIGERFYDDYPQLRLCTGYDHNMVVDGIPGELRPIGTAKSDKTGICLEAFTTEPSIQFYVGNYIQYDPVPHGKNGVYYPKNGGFCFEAQHYPDSVNHPNFPTTRLNPGEVYTQKTVYRFKQI